MSGAGGQPRLLRPRDGRVVLGLCAALARFVRTDVTIVRALFCVPATLGLLGVAWYFTHTGTCSSGPAWAIELSYWLMWLGVAVLLSYVCASALIQNENP